jgi:hypothetical protein
MAKSTLPLAARISISGAKTLAAVVPAGGV